MFGRSPRRAAVHRRRERALTSRRNAHLLALNCAVMVQHGVILLINGPIVPSLMNTFSIGESTVGMLLAFGSIGFVMGPLIAGTIIDRIGIGRAFLAGFAIELTFFALFVCFLFFNYFFVFFWFILFKNG